MQKLLNQRRTIYWIASFACIIFGFFALMFGLLEWDSTVSMIIGSALILAACLLGVLAMRSR